MGWTARSIFLGQGFSSPFLRMTGPTALVPPVFPYVLAACFRGFGLYTKAAAFSILTFNSICSALTCIPVYLLARNGLETRVARIAAFAWAIYPFAIYFSAARVWDYAATTLVFTCCLAIVQKLHLRSAIAWAGFGALYAFGVHTNPSITLLLPFLLLIAIKKMRRIGQSWRITVAHGAIASLMFVAVCTPWFIRNHSLMKHDFFVRDGFWLECYAGNNGDTSDTNSAFVHPASNSSEMRRYVALGETEYLAEKRMLAINYARQHKLFVIRATVRRTIRYWTGFWSFRHDYLTRDPLDVPNVPFTTLMTVMMVRGLIRWWSENEEAVKPYLLGILIFPIPYYLTHSSPDYRQPIEPLIVILVTVGFFGTGADRIQPEQEAEGAFPPDDDALGSIRGAPRRKEELEVCP